MNTSIFDYKYLCNYSYVTNLVYIYEKFVKYIS